MSADAVVDFRKAEAWRLVAERAKGPPLDVRGLKKDRSSTLSWKTTSSASRTISPVLQSENEDSSPPSSASSPQRSASLAGAGTFVKKEPTSGAPRGKLPFKKRRKLNVVSSKADNVRRTPSPKLPKKKRHSKMRSTSSSPYPTKLLSTAPLTERKVNLPKKGVTSLPAATPVPAAPHSRAQNAVQIVTQESQLESSTPNRPSSGPPAVSYTAEDEAAAAEALVSVVQSALVAALENAHAATSPSLHTSSLLASLQMKNQHETKHAPKPAAFVSANPKPIMYNKRNRSQSEPFPAASASAQLRHFKDEEEDDEEDHFRQVNFNHPHENPDVLSSKFPHTLPLYQPTYNKDQNVGIYTPSQREALLKKFRRKRQTRKWNKKVIRYNCRKDLADRRLRIKGRFVKRDEKGGHLLPSFFNGSSPHQQDQGHHENTSPLNRKDSTVEDDAEGEDCEEMEYHDATPDSPYRRHRRVTVA
jgi:hypothetical protein